MKGTEPPVNDPDDKWWNKLIEYALELNIPEPEGISFYICGVEELLVLFYIEVISKYTKKLNLKFQSITQPVCYVVGGTVSIMNGRKK